ncbi:MAG TPA: BadF/BadG/BcrA/BcrD ATPase family protein [Verrucomicrobiae bacterium]
MTMLGQTSMDLVAPSGGSTAGNGGDRFLGIDAGAETIKVLELRRDGESLRVTRRQIIEHGKVPGQVLLETLRQWPWASVAGAAISGRFASQVRLPRIPTKQAQIRAYRFLFGDEPATIINIGSHGFSVLELRASGATVFRENSRCSQGTGNFLRQLVERFSLTVEEASCLCADVAEPAPLSGRCPVILKTDMTHLANKGEDRARILAGLFDAVCENVLVLIKPGVSPSRVLLTGGVSRSPRVRRIFAEALGKMGMELVPHHEEELLCLEALGSALLAADKNPELPPLEELLLPPHRLNLEKLPALSASLTRVRRMPARPWVETKNASPLLVLGLDIGSTGSKAVALNAATSEVVWEAYRQTLGDPVGAAQELVRKFAAGPAGHGRVVALGATGSGREVAGSLLTSCYGPDAVFVVNEIVAHATGALHYDARVDTIFEIGGQDAKYIRLAEGRIIDCAMNEACSAGTGSFIEEQGRKFAGIEDVRQLGEAAVSATNGVSLGQHCSVFMAEVIDEAVAAGIDSPAIISGLYDSIIKNYLNRVKGNRSVGKVIFCQGMPFSADALAAAVARQTGSEVIVPPNPGTVGALGIALLAGRELDICRTAVRDVGALRAGLDLSRFLNASVRQKDSFICRATTGCGGAGNKCRIERLRTLVEEEQSQFTWGGACALHDKATRKRKLPNLAPDPFREREELLQKLLQPCLAQRDGPTIALTDEFMLKGLFPFFVTFFHEAGFQLKVIGVADQAMLKRGVQRANVPFCAPMQLFHGVAASMDESGADWIFIPMLRSVPAPNDQRRSVVCPVVQAAPDLLHPTLKARPGAAREKREAEAPHPTPAATRRLHGSGGSRLLSPILNFGKGAMESKEFLASCAGLAETLGLGEETWRAAWRRGLEAQTQFDAACIDSIERALRFCGERNVTAVIVLGRNYTIYNKTLNSNVPAILREQGAIAIPVEHYAVDPEVPQFNDMYWGYGQSILRAAHQVRRTPGVYALYCSNYSCGPDSFNLHFAAHVMEGKPFAIIETDGHSGDAGTKTRVEAFLHCVEEDRRAPSAGARLNNFTRLQSSGLRLSSIGRNNGDTEKMLVPHLGPASAAVAAVFRGLGLAAEELPSPDAESLRLGRRYTSGKECLPMPLTLGSLLQRLDHAQPSERFVYVMPGTDGPCRFGVYNLLNQIVLGRLGWTERLRIWAPKDSGYFDDLPAGTEMLMLSGIIATDLLRRALLEVRPAERVSGKAQAVYEQYTTRLLEQLEIAGRGDLRLAPALWQVARGGLFGVGDLLRRAAGEFAAAKGDRALPLIEMTGEIYVRAVDFSNDYLVHKLEERELRVRPAPQHEWLSYCSYIRRRRSGRNRLVDSFSRRVQHQIEAALFSTVAQPLGWPAPPTIEETLAAAAPYVSSALEGEAVLTVGASVQGWQRQEIDAVVAVGPLECMPTKIAEAQFYHVAEQDGLLTLTISFNGDPISTAALDNFAFEVHERFRQKHLGREQGLQPAAAGRNAILRRAFNPAPGLKHI